MAISPLHRDMPMTEHKSGKTRPRKAGDSSSSDHQREMLVRGLGGQLNALLSASRAVMATASAAFHPDLPPAAFHIANWLRSFGPANSSQVAQAVVMDRSATSRLTGRLIDLALIEAKPDPADGRGVVLSLTPSGRKRIDRAIERKGDLFRQKIENLSDADLEQLTALLAKFNSNP